MSNPDKETAKKTLDELGSRKFVSGARGGCGRTSLAWALVDWYDKAKIPAKKTKPRKGQQGGKR